MSPAAVLDRVGAACVNRPRDCRGALKAVAQRRIAPGRYRDHQPGDPIDAVALVCSRCGQAHGLTTPEELELVAVRLTRRRDAAENRGDLASVAYFHAEATRLAALAVHLRQAEASR